MSIFTDNSSKYNPISLTGTLHCPIYKIIMSISLKLSTSTYISFGPLLLDHPPSIPFHPTYTLPPHLHFQCSLKISITLILTFTTPPSPFHPTYTLPPHLHFQGFFQNPQQTFQRLPLNLHYTLPPHLHPATQPTPCHPTCTMPPHLHFQGSLKHHWQEFQI